MKLVAMMNDPFQHLAALLLICLTPLGNRYCSRSTLAQAFGCHTFHTSPSTRRRHPTATSRWSITTSFDRSHIMNPAAASGSNNDNSNDSNNDNDNRNDIIEKMRNYLESSWNIQTMGRVPSTPENAAEAAAQSIQSAKSDGIQQMMVNILLPSYDITQGEQFYDEILATQFCMSLSNHLQNLFALSSCTVLLRNGKAERYARRALRMDGTSNTKVIKDDNDDDSPSNHSKDGDNDTDLDDNGDATNETERFRQQLLRLEASIAWKNDSIEKNNDTTETQASSTQEEENNNDERILESDGIMNKAHAQLSSLLGDEAISKGTDMADDVVQAVTKRFRQSASHASNKDAVIILSSFSPEDMVAVRRLIQLYEGKDALFVLVNCKLHPIPRELVRSQVVYSLLPLTLRERVPQSTWINKQQQQQNQKNDYENTIKVIVLRRYPQDWDIFIDRNGSGFTLANTVHANPMERNGPSMERIAALVENYLKQTFREDGTIKQEEEDEDDNILQ